MLFLFRQYPSAESPEPEVHCMKSANELARQQLLQKILDDSDDEEEDADVENLLKASTPSWFWIFFIALRWFRYRVESSLDVD